MTAKPMPSPRVMSEGIEKTLQIAKHLWASKTESFQGRHYHLAEPINCPPPVSRPYPPILIAAGARKRPYGWWRSTPTPVILPSAFRAKCIIFTVLNAPEIKPLETLGRKVISQVADW